MISRLECRHLCRSRSRIRGNPVMGHEVEAILRFRSPFTRLWRQILQLRGLIFLLRCRQLRRLCTGDHWRSVRALLHRCASLRGRITGLSLLDRTGSPVVVAVATLQLGSAGTLPIMWNAGVGETSGATALLHPVWPASSPSAKAVAALASASATTKAITVEAVGAVEVAATRAVAVGRCGTTLAARGETGGVRRTGLTLWSLHRWPPHAGRGGRGLHLEKNLGNAMTSLETTRRQLPSSTRWSE